MCLKGKVILITGASSGIGAGAAVHLAKLGAKVAIVGRDETKLNGVAELIKKSEAPTPLKIAADVTKDAEKIVSQTISHFGKLDVLVNNAGIARQDNAADLVMSVFDGILDTNVRSVIRLTQLCVPHLEKTKGNVVNISSIAGLKPLPTMTSYCISKAALDQFTKCASLDLASKGIRVNSVNPGAIRTPIFKAAGMTEVVADKILTDIAAKYPVGRIGEVSDTSAAIAYLANDETASFLTGILLPCDGGAMVAGV